MSIKKVIKKIIPFQALKKHHLALQLFALIWYRFPARRLVVVGVTGTNGKTTTCQLITSILEAAGERVGLATTINFKIGNKEWVNETKMTTLGHFALQRLLRRMVKAGCKYAVIETSSHAIDQYRIWGVDFDVAVLTNVTPEHLDYHHTIEEYQRVKERFFDGLRRNRRKKGVPKVIVLNHDDASFSSFSRYWAEKKYAYAISKETDKSISHPETEGFEWVLAEDSELEEGQHQFMLSSPLGDKKVKLKIVGRFNVYNALAAAATALGLGFNLDMISRGLEGLLQVPGRMEKINEQQDFIVLVDYAVTPDAYEKLYDSIQDWPRNKIIWVFGATGDRDRSKRPVMGEFVARHADISIITNEDPFWEDPMRIIDEVLAGVEKTGKQKDKDWFMIFDRREAIQLALEKAEKGDIVLITGKGAETKMAVRDERLPWNEREIVRELLKEKLKTINKK